MRKDQLRQIRHSGRPSLRRFRKGIDACHEEQIERRVGFLAPFPLLVSLVSPSMLASDRRKRKLGGEDMEKSLLLTAERLAK